MLVSPLGTLTALGEMGAFDNFAGNEDGIVDTLKSALYQHYGLFVGSISVMNAVALLRLSSSSSSKKI